MEGIELLGLLLPLEGTDLRAGLPTVHSFCVGLCVLPGCNIRLLWCIVIHWISSYRWTQHHKVRAKLIGGL
jgi:hypothetical protein